MAVTLKEAAEWSPPVPKGPFPCATGDHAYHRVYAIAVNCRDTAYFRFVMGHPWRPVESEA